MSKLRLMAGIGLCVVLSGCVIGSGPAFGCRSSTTLRDTCISANFRAADGVDNVPILILDKTQYIYAPPQSFRCLPANDLQLIGVTELPSRIDEGSRVIVDGKVLEGVAQDQHTRFVIDVVSILPLKDKH